MMNQRNILLSEYGNASVTPAPVSRMMSDFAADFREGIDINLGVGYVNESTIPRRLIEQALHEVLAQPEKYRQALNYGDPKGSANLIHSIREFLLENQIGDLTEDVLNRNEIVIGPSGATSLLEGIAHVLPPGIVLTSDPMYYIYCHFLERCGFEVVTIPEDDQGLSAELLQKKLDRLGSKKQNIRFIYSVTINNPTCTILSNTRRRELVDLTARLSSELNRKIPLILDKAYENLIHDPNAEKPQSALLYDKNDLVYEIATLSKIVAPALRIGYMIGSNCDFLKAMIQYVSDVGFSAPLITQEIAAYILDYHVADQVDFVNQGYREKAIKTKKWIDEYLGEYITECRGGAAGFYYYLTFKNIFTEETSPLFKTLTRTTGDPTIDGPPENKHPRVIYIPGQFCVHPHGDLTELGRRQLRLSYGFENLPQIHDALKLMRDAVKSAG
jgi:2-aminoadipate transaminase